MIANDPIAHPVMAALDAAIHALILEAGAAMNHSPGYLI
jgi:hypothetical protein